MVELCLVHLVKPEGLLVESVCLGIEDHCMSASLLHWEDYSVRLAEIAIEVGVAAATLEVGCRNQVARTEEEVVVHHIVWRHYTEAVDLVQSDHSQEVEEHMLDVLV